MDLNTAQNVVDRHALPHPIVDITFLDKGYSSDKKFVLTSDAGQRFLLRLSPISESPQRNIEFMLIHNLHEHRIKCPRGYAVGQMEDCNVCYMVLDYIEGECAEEALPNLSLDDQQQVGMESGQELRRIHDLMKPGQPVDDYHIRTTKYAKHIARFEELGFSFTGQERAARYVEKHTGLLKNRPGVFRHGDYHPGNLIVLDSHLAGVIDFNRCDFGDPYDEFYKIAWFGAPLSAEYACGHLRGYFDGDPPADFWPIYNLYVAMVLPADLVWTQTFFPNDLRRSFELIDKIVALHDFESGGPPKWWQ